MQMPQDSDPHSLSQIQVLPRPKFLLVTTMKNEGPYILEWIAYHIAIGIDHFMIVTNDCTDGTNEILEILQKKGLVTLVINPNTLARDPTRWQRNAQAIVQHYPLYRRAEWILHCDVDEFVQFNNRDIETLNDLVEALSPVDVISLTSIPFNSNGINGLLDLPVTTQFLQNERYLTKDRTAFKYTGEPKNDHSAIKPLFRNALGLSIRGNHRPYHPKFSSSGYIWKDGSGRQMPVELTDGRGQAVISADTIFHVQLNHYAIRSVEASMLKFDRGDVTGNVRLDRSVHYFKNYDNPGQDDTRLARPHPKMKKLYNSFMRDKHLSFLHKRAFEIHKARFQELIKTGDSYALARALGYFDSERRGIFLAESAAQTSTRHEPAKAQVTLKVPKNPTFELPQISSLWVGPPISFVERLCMQSFVDAGHKFTLYSTDKLRDLPDGVTIEDPRDIYQADFPTGPEHRHNNAVYADIFRLHMIRKTGAIWADMDAYCLKPFIFPSGYAVGLEEATAGVFTACNGIVGFPNDSETLNECLNLVTQKNPIPPFFNGGRRTRLRERTKNGDIFGFQDFSWGTSGPRLIHYFMEITGELKYAVPKDVFYPGPRAFRRPLLRPEYASEVFERPETVSVHIFGKTKSFLKDDYGGDLPENCYLDRLCKRHGIDPKAHPV